MYQPHSDEAPEYHKLSQDQVNRSRKAYNLPENYGRTMAVLQIIDPFKVHLYWEVKEDYLRHVQMKLSDHGMNASSHATIRLFMGKSSRCDENVFNQCSEYDIDLGYNGYYIKVPEDDRSYFAQIGMVGEDGHFVEITRSNTVHTPRYGVSELCDPEWMSIEELLSERYVRGWGQVSSQGVSYKSKAIICSGSGGIL